MRTKEAYYQSVLENRALAADPAVMRCTCPNELCDWHGKCQECVALHRHHSDHVPFCLQPILRDKVRAIAGVVEMEIQPRQATPIEYRRYVKQRDKGSE